MSRDPRHDVLFEPVPIGPVTAKNRFYQVPHCNGMGRTFPSSMAAMRGVKAEGGWAVVSTEQIDIHPSADITPGTEGRLWSDQDIPYLARMCDAVHEHDSLALIELAHNGKVVTNSYSREAPLFPSHMPVAGVFPAQARAMDKQDIRDYRRWHLDAVKRAKIAGFDIICCYAAHNLSLAGQFMLRRYNYRTDEYGGSLENRVRLFRELIEDTKDAVGDSLAVVARFAVDEMRGADGMQWDAEGREIVEMLAELPDLWDVNVAEWDNDSQTSRFSEEGFQEPFIGFVKQVTSKPVVAVGRYTSADRMASLIKNGVLDMIGAARPSIADPFLPKKIEEGRIEDIRECIGCNICVSWNNIGAPMRCTQNATTGEEWRRGWHPERIPAKRGDDTVLIVGAGPAGLEAALAAAQRGYPVTLAEATASLGGRVERECRLPGLSDWGRVRDYRVYQLQQRANVEIFPGGALDAPGVLEVGATQVCIATGAHWRRRRVRSRTPGADPRHRGQKRLHAGRHHGRQDAGRPGAGLRRRSLLHGRRARREAGGGGVRSDPGHSGGHGFRVDQIDAGARPPSWPDCSRSTWTLVTEHKLDDIGEDEMRIRCVYTQKTRSIQTSSVVMVTSRRPDDALYYDLNR